MRTIKNKVWFKKNILLGVMLIMSLGLLAACQKTLSITDFDGLADLPRNPSRIVFGTNSNNYDDENGIYGEPIEYEIESEKSFEIIERLFDIKYKAYPKRTVIDLSPIINYLIFYTDDGEEWTVDLGLRRHNERWYYPTNGKDLITFLHESITL